MTPLGELLIDAHRLAVGAYLPKRHRPIPAAERLLAALRTHALAKFETQT